MARNIKPNNDGVNFPDTTGLKDKYSGRYPDGVDLSPDSETHRKLLKFILDSVKASYDVMSIRYPTWKEIEEKLTVFVDLDADDQKIRDADPSKPVAMVVPISYATREVLLTYMTAAFLKHPLFRYIPSEDPRDLIKVIALESIIAQDCIRSKVGLDLYTMWGDEVTFGFGVASPTWVTKQGYKTVYNDVVESLLGVPYKKRTVQDRKPIVTFDGSALRTIDVYNFYPDPDVPVTDVENMEFCCWIDRTSYHKLLMEEAQDDTIFNVKYLSKLESKSSSYFNATDTNTGRYSKTGITFDGTTPSRSSNHTDVHNFYAWIVPSEYGLSSSENPEHWSFKVAADRIIIEAKRSNFDHNQHPIAVMAPDSDGHTTVPVSLLEREFPLQHAMDWLWKAHVANLRKAVNNMFLADPSKIDITTLTDTRFGLLALTRAAAWGTDVRNSFMQIPVQDVTKENVRDIGFLMDIDSRVFTSDQSKGFIERRGERVSASEAGGARVSFLSKMERRARIGAMQGHYDIAYQFGSNTIQLKTREQVIHILGDYKDVLLQQYGVDFDYAKVDPKTLDVRFDVVPQDGSIPMGEYADIWEHLLGLATKNPDVYQTLDPVRIWLHIARLLGAKNPEEFKRKPMTSRVASQEEIDKGKQSGQLVTPQELEEAANVEEV
jgi:hypothetical protein